MPLREPKNLEPVERIRFRYRKLLLSKDSLVIVVSQSGETADSLAALRAAKALGVPTLAIVNVIGSTIAREADHDLVNHDQCDQIPRFHATCLQSMQMTF